MLISSRSRNMKIKNMILKGIDVCETPGFALFGVSDSDIVLHYANVAFKQMLGDSVKDYEKRACNLFKKAINTRGFELIVGVQQGVLKEGATKIFEVPVELITDSKEKQIVEVEVTYLEEYCKEIFISVMVREKKKNIVSLKREKRRRNMKFDIRPGQVCLYLQPKFNIRPREVIGAEALTRCVGDDGSVIMPSDFIPYMEEQGSIAKLDFYIYESLLIFMKECKEQGFNMLPVSVNFSRANIQSEDFVKRVCELSDKYEIDRSLIEIEITESTLSGNEGKLLNDMKKLQRAGFKIDMDDFGTGYSSLNMLLTAPVDTVKVDKSFIDDIVESERNRKYVNHIADLIKIAEKDIIFEGVETECQAEILREYGYGKAQGFLFGKAVPADEFANKYLLKRAT